MVAERLREALIPTAYAGARSRGLKIWLAFWLLLGVYLSSAAFIAQLSLLLASSTLCFTLLLLPFLYLWSLVDAHRTARGSAGSRPGVAALMSLLVPGQGQAYLDRDRRGWCIWLFLVGPWVMALLTLLEAVRIPDTLATALLVWAGMSPLPLVLASAYDAYRLGKRLHTKSH